MSLNCGVLMRGEKAQSNSSGSAGVSTSDQGPPKQQRRRDRKPGSYERRTKKLNREKIAVPSPENCQRWSGGKSGKKVENCEASRRTKHKQPTNVHSPSAPLIDPVLFVSAAFHHRKLEVERSEVDSLRNIAMSLLLNRQASANKLFSDGFAAGLAAAADQAVDSRDRQIEELKKELATARKAAASQVRQTKSDGKQIAELQAQLEKSRDEIVSNKLEIDRAWKEEANVRRLKSMLTDYCGLAGEILEPIVKSGQWQKHFSNFEPGLRAQLVKLYKHCCEDDSYWDFQ